MKLRYYINRIKARRVNRFRIKALKALRPVIGGYLACAYAGHKIEMYVKWTDDLYGFSCMNCPLHYLKKQKNLTDQEKQLIAEKEKN